MQCQRAEEWGECFNAARPPMFTTIKWIWIDILEALVCFVFVIRSYCIKINKCGKKKNQQWAAKEYRKLAASSTNDWKSNTTLPVHKPQANRVEAFQRSINKKLTCPNVGLRICVGMTEVYRAASLRVCHWGRKRRYFIICAEWMGNPSIKIAEGEAYSNNGDGCSYYGLKSAQENEQASKSERKAFIQLYAILFSLDTAAAAKNRSNQRQQECIRKKRWNE